MIIDSVRDMMSGVLIDPQCGFRAFLNPNKPYLMCMEKSGYTDKVGERVTELEYSASELKDMGAEGTKLLIYFNPEGKNCAKQLETAKTAMLDSQKNNMPFFLEIVTYGNEKNKKSRSEYVIKSLEQFLCSDIRPDVFKLEYPDDAKSCKKITEMLGGIPWILLTRGENYKIFKKQLKDALANGAKGFLAGRAIWQEISEYPKKESKQYFLETVARVRFKEICDMALGE